MSYLMEKDRSFKLATKGIATVLITGPTGSGKTHLARKIHEQSARKYKPFVTVNLASLHEGTFESELFGHERGAFTGAESRRVGKLELAQGGTVFLDEVGELSPRLQARLLEFLQSRTLSPVGSNREVRLDVRVIAATNRDLKLSVSRGEFREDLFHRLRVLAIPLQPLSSRTDEFGELVHATLSEACVANGKSILKLSEQFAQRLERHNWPGNLRELRNVLEYAVLSADGDQIGERDLPPWFAEDSVEELPVVEQVENFNFARLFAGLSFPVALERFEKDFIESALQRHRGRINHTAVQIGMNKTTLLRRMRSYGISAQVCAESLLR